MAAVHVYTVSQLIHIPHLLVMILSEAYQVNASLIPTIEAAWQVPQVQTTYRCNMMAIATSHSSSEYRSQIRAHDTSSCEKVDFLIVDATVFCSSTTEVKPKLSKKICRAPTLARPSNGY